MLQPSDAICQCKHHHRMHVKLSFQLFMEFQLPKGNIFRNFVISSFFWFCFCTTILNDDDASQSVCKRMSCQASCTKQRVPFGVNLKRAMDRHAMSITQTKPGQRPTDFFQFLGRNRTSIQQFPIQQLNSLLPMKRMIRGQQIIIITKWRLSCQFVTSLTS